MDAPPVINPAPRRFPWPLAGGLTLLATAAAAVFFFFDPSQYHFYPRCMLHATTGLECPGCGSQRAIYQLLHGHLSTALRCNALLVLSLPLLAFGLVRFSLRWLANGSLPSFNLSPRWIILLFAILTVFTILRNLPCAPFNYLAPP